LAVALDAELRDLNDGNGLHYLHRSMKPLEDVDLSAPAQTTMDLCEEGRCEF
jgi:hypothetical protein